MKTREQIQAEELDAYLTQLQSGRRPPRPAGLPADEGALLEGLLALVEAQQPDPDYAAELENRLKAAARRRLPAERVRSWWPKWLQELFRVEGRGVKDVNVRVVAYALGAVALVALLFVAVAVLLPGERPDDRDDVVRVTMTPSTGGQGEMTEAPPASDSQTAIETPAVTPIPVPQGPPLLPPLYAVVEGGFGGGGQGGGNISPETTFVLQATLPESPEQVPAYVQREPAPLTRQEVEQMAARLGLEGLVYVPRPDGAESQTYVALDEPRRMWFHGSWLLYEDRGRPDYGYPPQGAPDPDQSIERAVQFLETAGLLETPYQVLSTTNTIMLHRTLGSGWVVSEPFARVVFGPDGEVSSVSYERFDLAEVGNYPILSAREAWEILSAPEPGARVWYDRYTGAGGLPWGDWGDWARYNPRFWSREYTIGQRAHLFGGLEILYPVEAGGTLHVTMRELVLSGDLQPLAEAYQALVDSAGVVDVPIAVWGVVQDAGGYRTLQVEGWQVEEWQDSALSLPYNWTGTVQRGEPDLLLVDGGRTVAIADLPADLADGTGVFVTGGEVDGVLEWCSIQESLVDGGLPTGPAPQPARVEATVEQVDLIYLIPRANYVPAGFDWGYRAPQPVWRFRGHTDQGSGFVVYVQAVEDAYLSPEP